LACQGIVFFIIAVEKVLKIDEPNIPIEPPAEEDDEEPGDNITNNENNDTGDIGEPPIAKEPIGPANETGDADNATTTDDVVCPAILETMFKTDKKTYKQGEDVIVSGYSTAGGRTIGNEGTPVELSFLGPGGVSYGSPKVQPKYSDCSFSYTYVLKNVQQVGAWEVSAFYPPDEGGEVIGKTQFEVVPAEQAGCQRPPAPELGTEMATYNVGDDVFMSGLFSASPRDRENNTPVEVTYKGPQDASYRSVEVQPKYGTFSYDDDCGYLQFEFVIKNVQQVGLWDVFAVYPPLNIHLYTQFVVYSGQGPPRCEDLGQPGNGNTDDDYCRDDQRPRLLIGARRI
jgi:hypothetical protein